jgi:hypothetical protein
MNTFLSDASLIDGVLKISQAFALFVGGFWVYWNYIRGRTHTPRLQLDLKAEFLRKESRNYLLATVAVKNPGLGLVRITQQGSVLLVSRYSSFDDPPNLLEPDWQHDGAFDVLVGVVSIEPGVTFTEQRLLALSHDESQSYWLKLRVVAHKRSYRTIAIVCPGATINQSSTSK